MIVINKVYFGCNTGNQLYRYCWARIIAEKKGYKLINDPILGFPSTYEPLDGVVNNQNWYVTPGGTQQFDMTAIFNHDGAILIDGYPQRYSYYGPYQEKIKQWLFIENEFLYEKPSPDDIIINVRLGDFVSLGRDLPMNYYLKILKKETYKNAIVICDEPNHPYLDVLKKEGCIIKDNFEYGKMKFLADFVFVKNSKKTIISNSTFSWWAAYLGDGIVYLPLLKWPWLPNPSPDEDDPMVPESRYIAVETI